MYILLNNLDCTNMSTIHSYSVPQPANLKETILWHTKQMNINKYVTNTITNTNLLWGTKTTNTSKSEHIAEEQHQIQIKNTIG